MQGMSLKESLFNNHVNEARKKVDEFFQLHLPEAYEEILKIEKEGNGIMEILNRPPTENTQCYAILIAYVVNTGLELPHFPSRKDMKEYVQNINAEWAKMLLDKKVNKMLQEEHTS